MPEEILTTSTSSPFKSSVVFDVAVGIPGRKNPKTIKISKADSNEPIIEFNTDAVDCMGFCNIGAGFESLSESEQQVAVEFFSNELDAHFGGKNFFAVPKKFQSLFEKYNFHASPTYPNQSAYKRLMFVNKEILLANVKKQVDAWIEKNKDTHDYIPIRFILDKTELKTRAEEISRLFIENASYASQENKRKAYCAEAIISRLENPNVTAIAYSKENKILGFLRLFTAQGIGVYASDLVTAGEFQHQGVALSMTYQATLELDQEKRLFLIAGDDKEAKYYEEKLGCKAICDEKEVVLDDDKVFMFKLIPQQHLLVDYLTSFPMPEGPKAKAQEPSAASLITQFSAITTTTTTTTTSPSPTPSGKDGKEEQDESQTKESGVATETTFTN